MESGKSIQTAFELYQSGQLDEAEKIVRELLKETPDNTEILHLLGLIFSKRGDYARALRNIRKALKLDPNDAEIYFDLGNVLHDKGQIATALTNYRKAVKLNPKFVEAYNNMGIAYQDKLQIEKAIHSYKKALDLEPAYAEAHNNLGVAFQEKGQLDEAITHFQQALLLRPDYASAYNNLIDAVQGKGQDAQQKSGKDIIYAIYRCSSGEDFIQESIRSVTDHVDKIFVFINTAPWGNTNELLYKGKMVKFPSKLDNIDEKIRELNNPKVSIAYEHSDIGNNHLTRLVNDTVLPKHEKPSMLISLEADHVFTSEQIGKALDEFEETGYVFATTSQIEIWKGLKHRLPDRPTRVGAVFCNLSKLNKMPETMKHGGILVMPKLSASVHNFSFAVSEKVMYWRFLLSIALAQKNGEAAPYESWYEAKWLTWDYDSNNENIGGSDQLQVERAIPYDFNDLPAPVKEKYFR